MTAEYPWKPSPWSIWAEEHKIKLPNSVTPPDGYQLNKTKVHYSKELVDMLESGFSMTMREHLDKFNKLPIWTKTYLDRGVHSILTPHRAKKFIAHVTNKSEKDRSFIEETIKIFNQGGFIFKPDDVINKKLLRGGIRIVEKELLKSRNNRMIVYRFLTKEKNPVGIATINWFAGQDLKHLKLEKRNSNNKWRVTKKEPLVLDEGLIYKIYPELDDYVAQCY